MVVSVAWPNSILPTPSAAVVEATKPVIGRPVAFVSVPDVGVPKAPPDVSNVADDGIVVELIVKPLTLLYVVPEAMVVEPRVGAE